jgi:hypothetical protein
MAIISFKTLLDIPVVCGVGPAGGGGGRCCWITGGGAYWGELRLGRACACGTAEGMEDDRGGLATEFEAAVGGEVAGNGGGGALGCRIGVDLDLEGGSGTPRVFDVVVEAGRSIFVRDPMNRLLSYFPCSFGEWRGL